MKIFEILSIKKVVKIAILQFISLFIIFSLRFQNFNSEIYFYFEFSVFSLILSLFTTFVGNLLLFLKVFYDIKKGRWV